MASCASHLRGTKRMVGRWQASAQVSASFQSFFSLLTSGFTYMGGISRGSCPCARKSRPR